MKKIMTSIRTSLVFIVICGFIYPIFLTGVSQIIFPKQANGSIINVNGKEVGSELIGQKYESGKYFIGRVSSINYNNYEEKDTKPDAGGKVNYSGVGSGSTNFASSNKDLAKRVDKDIEEFLKNNPGVKKEEIPTDLLTNSGSGLDYMISIQAANIQVRRISKKTEINQDKLKELIKKNTTLKPLGIFGESGVNVVKLNLDVYKIINNK